MKKILQIIISIFGRKRDSAEVIKNHLNIFIERLKYLEIAERKNINELQDELRSQEYYLNKILKEEYSDLNIRVDLSLIINIDQDISYIQTELKFK